MRLLLRQGLIFLLLLFVVGTVRFSPHLLGGPAAALLADRLAAGGVRLQYENARLGFPAVLQLDDVGVLAPLGLLPLPLAFEQVRLRLRVLPLFLLNADLAGDFKGYGGKLSLTSRRGLFHAQTVVKLTAADVRLEQHPLASSYGLRGALNASLRATASAQGSISAATVRLELANAEYAGGHTIRSLLRLPPTKEISLLVEADKVDEVVKLERLSFSSSLGSVAGTFRGYVDSGLALRRGEGEFIIRLKEEGEKIFAPYLLLAARRPVKEQNPPRRNWRLTVGLRQDGLPAVQVQPLEEVRDAGGR